MKNNQTRYLSPKQIFEFYGIETKKIYYWIRQKRIDYIKAGIKTVLVPEAKLIEFLENNMVNRTQ